MYTEVFLTEHDLLVMDPTGRGRRSLLGYKREGSPTPMCKLLVHQDRQYYADKLKTLISRLYTARHAVYWQYNESFFSKYGPQGDRFSLEELQTHYIRSYELAERKVVFHRRLIQARDYFIRMLKQTAEQYGYPQIDYYTRGVTGTSGALPTMCEKGSFLAETVGFKHWRHVQPDLPGQRSQRQKHRCINQDATANVRYIEAINTAVRNWMKRYFPQFTSSWIEPSRELAPRITRALRLNKQSVEADYEGCDEHYSWDIVATLILPLFEVLLPKMQFIRYACFIEELFQQPIFFGNTMWTGKHNLLSGQGITNDYETYYDIINAIASLIDNGIFVPDADIIVNGDDVSVLVANKAQQVMDSYVNFANLAGMDIELSKSRIGKGDVRFCKKVYYGALPKAYNCYGEEYIIGAYPYILALNNTVNPERLIRDSAELVKATVQRLDVPYGAPNYETYVQFVGSELRWPGVSEDEIDAATTYDWWERVYGERWTLAKSPAYQLLKKNNLW